MKKLLIAMLTLVGASAIADSPADYYSLHQLPYTQFQDSAGSLVTLPGGYRNQFNYKNEFIGCNLGLAINTRCRNSSLSEDISYAYLEVDARKPPLNLGGRFKIWLPKGLKKLDITGYMPQGVYANVQVRFREPPDSDPGDFQTTEGALPENNLGRIASGEEFTIGGTTNGSLEVSSKAGSLPKPLEQGGWLYFIQGGTTRITYLNIGLIVEAKGFKADYDSLTFGPDNDPVSSTPGGVDTPPGTTTPGTTTPGTVTPGTGTTSPGLVIDKDVLATQDKASLKITHDATAYFFWVIKPSSAAAPEDALTIISGSSDAKTGGEFTLSKGVASTLAASGLSPGTSYTLYMTVLSEGGDFLTQSNGKDYVTRVFTTEGNVSTTPGTTTPGTGTSGTTTPGMTPPGSSTTPGTATPTTPPFVLERNTAGNALLTVNLSPSAADLGKQASIYVVAVIAGGVFFTDGTAWIPLNPFVSNLKPVMVATLKQPTPVVVLRGDFPASTLTAVQTVIYVAYTTNDSPRFVGGDLPVYTFK